MVWGEKRCSSPSPKNCKKTLELSVGRQFFLQNALKLICVTTLKDRHGAPPSITSVSVTLFLLSLASSLFLGRKRRTTRPTLLGCDLPTDWCRILQLISALHKYPFRGAVRQDYGETDKIATWRLKNWYSYQMPRNFKRPDGFVMLLSGFVAYIFIIIQFILKWLTFIRWGKQ